MLQVKKQNTVQNVIVILIGALLMGFLWRIRGTSGWGSSWGLLNAGFVFSMFIVLIKGERQKQNFGWLALTALSFMLTVPAWGTLLSQITGILFETENTNIQAPHAYISVPSAIFLMLCLGFGLATLFGIMLGRGYSSKQWKIIDFVIVIAVFYIVDLITKATVSHWILDLIQPEAVNIFEKGLTNAGVEGTAHEVYLQHFNDTSWAKKLDGGRNYFASIQAISSAFRSIAAILAVRFIVKDKTGAKTGLVVSGAFAFSITVSDLFFYFGNGGYHMQNESPFGEWIYPWSCWEYFTGFIAGGIITAFVLNIKNKEDVTELAFSKVPQKVNNILTFILTFVFMVGVNIVRPVLERFEDSKYQILAIVIAVVATVAVVVLINFKWGFNAKNVSSQKLYEVLFPLFVAYIFVAYMFIGTAAEQEFRNITSLHIILCIISVAVILIWNFTRNKTIKTINKR